MHRSVEAVGIELLRLNGVINNLTHWGPNAESLQRDYDYLLQEFNALQKLHENDLDFDNIEELRGLVEDLEMKEMYNTHSKEDWDELHEEFVVSNKAWWYKASLRSLAEWLVKN